MSKAVDLLACAWTELREQLGGPVLELLGVTNHDCPRILGSMDDLMKSELAEYFEHVAARAKVPALPADEVDLLYAVVRRAGALRSHGIRVSEMLKWYLEKT